MASRCARSTSTTATGTARWSRASAAGRLMTAVRLGLRQVKGLAEQEARRLVAARLKPYRTLEELRRRAGVRRATLVTLAEADAFRSLGLDRRQALWAVQALKDQALPLFDHAMARPARAPTCRPSRAATSPGSSCPRWAWASTCIEDYATLRLSLKAHPLALLRDWLDPQARHHRPPALAHRPRPPRHRLRPGPGPPAPRQRQGRHLRHARGRDRLRQPRPLAQPRSSSFRATVMTARLLAATGTLQREGRVIHVIAERLTDLTPSLRRLRDHALDPKLLDGAMSRADEFKREPRDLRTRCRRGGTSGDRLASGHGALESGQLPDQIPIRTTVSIYEAKTRLSALIQALGAKRGSRHPLNAVNYSQLSERYLRIRRRSASPLRMRLSLPSGGD